MRLDPSRFHSIRALSAWQSETNLRRYFAEGGLVWPWCALEAELAVNTRHYFSAALVWPLLLATPSIGSAGQFLDPLEQPAVLDGVSLAGRMFGIGGGGDGIFAVGADGRILRTQSGGKSWKQIPSPVSSDLTAVAFATPRKGFVVGHDGVLLRSEDGGDTWVRVFDFRSLYPELLEHYKKSLEGGDGDRDVIQQWIDEISERIGSESPLPLFDVWFSDARNGYAVGAFNMLLVTEDGGDHWTPRMEFTDNRRGAHLYAVCGTPGPDGDVYIAGEIGTLMRLDRASGRFVSIPTPYDGTYFALAVDGDSVVVAGLRGNAYLSVDKGADWRRLETGTVASIASASPLRQKGFALMAQNGSIVAFDGRGVPLGESTPSLRRAAYVLHVAQDGASVVGTDAGMKNVNLGTFAR